MNMAIFDNDLNDSLDDLLEPAQPGQPLRERPTPPASYQPQTHFEPCRKCGGTGMTRWGVCFRCKGKRGKTFKTSSADRAHKRQQATARREAVAAATIETFRAEQPEVLGWLEQTAARIEAQGGSWQFPGELLAKLRRYGSLTDGQIAAVRRFMERDAQRAAERSERRAAAPVVEVARIEEAFEHARAKGLKKLKLFLDVFTFKPAKATGRNPGAIYVTEDGTYLGKIAGGKFLRVRDCSDDQQARIVAACADPATAAKAFGKHTGRCSCCGRELTDPASIAAGIGPVCAENYGF